MKFVLAIFSYTPKHEDNYVKREYYCGNRGDHITWGTSFDRAQHMDLETALEAYQRCDSPMRKLGLIPVI